MNYIVGDIGNTLTKISLLNKNFKIVKSHSVETKKLNNIRNLNNFCKKIIIKNLNKKILFSSVVPKVFKSMKVFFIKKKYKLLELKNLNLNSVIKFRVDDPKKVGSDRIANAIGASNDYRENIIIIDFGTATTFDVVKKSGFYDGGVIAPGITLSIKNLYKSTALLPLISLKNKQKNYGKNTYDALNAGFLWGYEGLINNIIKKISLKSKKNYKILLTGGYAKIFQKYIKKKATIDENITIKGLIKIYKELLI